MDRSLSGKAKELEVASMLADAGFYVFWPFVDKGYDLVVTNVEERQFVPIQVRYRVKDPALGLVKKQAERFAGKNVFLAFLNGERPNQRVWFLPFDKWSKMTVDRGRRDNLLYVPISENEEKLSAFEGANGLSVLRRAFGHERRSRGRRTRA